MDDYTVQVIDVFAMPQTGTGVSVEAVDPVFQAKMLDMLKQTGRPEMLLDGIIHILVLDAGYLVLISIHNSRLKHLANVLLPLSSIQFNRLREKL